ncbi:hypothetical protein EK21DRAFT_93115 [Setomelanomma holmii]|uniref:Uncharacterized protein n=1 Tax=Setomelanomma holmii TaxID=210430 RepID=A0A9P4LIZ2_9PLEO|nr:hypothetical protein EK21DRAFT_93115 [Setomelanomma holmii]
MKLNFWGMTVSEVENGPHLALVATGLVPRAMNPPCDGQRRAKPGEQWQAAVASVLSASRESTVDCSRRRICSAAKYRGGESHPEAACHQFQHETDDGFRVQGSAASVNLDSAGEAAI